jgi:hypothetical protein
MGPYPEAIEADICRYYPGRSIAEFWQGRMTLRELRVLVAGLPVDSATARAIRGHHWQDADYLLADIADTLRFHRAEWAQSKGAKPGKPKQVSRPKAAAEHAGPSHRDVAQAAHAHIMAQIRAPNAEGSD